MSHHLPGSCDLHRHRLPFLLALSATLALSACGGSDGAAPAPAPAPAPVVQNATAQLALLETTDLHYYARSFNYYSDKED